jgi:hypothetical protein
MASDKDLRRLALSLEGTTEIQHFDRAAFKVARIYATIATDRLTANFHFTPDEQALKCILMPKVFSPLPNAWGKKGWTVGILSGLGEDDLNNALRTAWAHGKKAPKPAQK